MPARRTGSLKARQTRGGVVFDLRFSATIDGNSERQNVTLRGVTREDAERELRGILADVERGTWQPPKPPPVVEVADDPTFHEFATDWFEASKGEWREATRLDYLWQLEMHLLPFFKDHRLSQITVAEVDRFRGAKVAAGKLGAASINKCITRLGQVLELAVERELIARNPAKVGGKRRKLKAPAPRRAYLDRAEQIEALLTAAGQLDAGQKSNGRMHRRAILSTLVFSGLRISELLALTWRDVDLPAGRLRVRESKTDAGIRYVDLLPVLRDVLVGLKADRDPRPDALVFPSAAGTRQDRNRVRTRVLGKAIKRADANLAKAELSALPDGLTLHALRRTYASVLVAIGNDTAYVIGQLGHTDPAVTYGKYAKAIRPEDRERLRTLAEGVEVVRSGDEGDSEAQRPAVTVAQ
jgi:integrase